MQSVDTKLFINGLPVDYRITHRKCTFYFEPMFNPHTGLEAPLFSAILHLGKYQFKGIKDNSLQDQAEEDMKTLF